MELTTDEQTALIRLYKYGAAEDCRSSHAEVAAFESLAVKGLTERVRDETYITEAGRERAKELCTDTSKQSTLAATKSHSN